jgi:hypothetical protein
MSMTSSFLERRRNSSENPEAVFFLPGKIVTFDDSLIMGDDGR